MGVIRSARLGKVHGTAQMTYRRMIRTGAIGSSGETSRTYLSLTVRPEIYHTRNQIVESRIRALV